MEQLKPFEYAGVIIIPMHIVWIAKDDTNITLHLSDGSSHTETIAVGAPKLEAIGK